MIANSAPERAYFDRIVSLENQKADIAEDIKTVYAEAKEDGLTVKSLRLAVKRHLEPRGKRKAREDTESDARRILIALGEFVNTPLGDAAARIARDIKNGEVDIKFGSEPWMSEQLADK